MTNLHDDVSGLERDANDGNRRTAMNGVAEAMQACEEAKEVRAEIRRLFEPTPIELWLTLRDAEIGVDGRIVFEDETTRGLQASALSIRGAEREMTGWLLTQGYKAAGHWEISAEQADEAVEVVRRFIPVDESAATLREGRTHDGFTTADDR